MRLKLDLVFASLSVAVFAILATALCSHIAIDVLGDYLLPHDTYDDVRHGSRLTVFVVAASMVVLALLTLARAVPREPLLYRLRSPRTLLGATAVIAAGGLLALGAMQASDVVSAGGTIDDLGDLFGGSLAFGATIEFVTACIVVAALRALAVAVDTLCERAARVLALLDSGPADAPAAARAFAVAPARGRVAHLAPLAHRSGLRAPPSALPSAS